MNLNAFQFKQLFPQADLALLPFLNVTFVRYDIDSPVRAAAYLAQVGHECAGFTKFVENLNYGAQGLLATWPKRFTPEQAADYARDPERIANHVYGGRMGNGPEETGDGYTYRGRGAIMTTGKANYTILGVRLAIDLVAHPELLEQPEAACLSGGDFWYLNNFNTLADIGHFDEITQQINGGQNGAADRHALWEKAKVIFP